MDINTDDDVKTRGQKERLEQITTPTTEEGANGDIESGDDKPTLKKEGTMAVTAKVSISQ